jgi:hypothetical protein
MNKKYLIILISSILMLALLVFFNGECEMVIVSDYEDSPFGFIQGGSTNDIDLGVHWDNPLRAGIGITEYSDEIKENVDFTKLDEIINEYVIENDINILVAISPFRSKPIPGSDPDFLTPTEYAELVSYVVERYDGDGIDDMEGSPTLKYWYLGYNEMDLKSFSNAKQIASLVASGYEAVKNQNSNFVPILGGSGNINTWNEGGLYYNIISELSYFNCCQDIMIDYHYWSPPEGWKRQVEKLNIVQNALENFGFTDNKIFCKEAGSWDEFGNDKECKDDCKTKCGKDIECFESCLSDCGGPTEIDQAGDVIRRYIHSISNGLEKLFWTRVMEFDWTPDDSKFFDFTGLINNPANVDGKSHKKLSYYSGIGQYLHLQIYEKRQTGLGRVVGLF